MDTDDSHMTIAKLSALTPAEQAVLDQALTGVPAREIAEHLSISEGTVRSHLSSIYVKLGVSGRVALLAHFRGGESSLPAAQAAASPRPRSAYVVGWSWAIVSLLEGAYAVYLGSGALANGGSHATWVLTMGSGSSRRAAHGSRERSSSSRRGGSSSCRWLSPAATSCSRSGGSSLDLHNRSS